MLRKYTFWFWAAVGMQLLTGIFHSISLFVSPEPANATEVKMLTLMTTYRIDAGAGFHPTYSGLFTALSSCFTFLCLFAASTNGYLMLKKIEPSMMRGIIAINLLIFGAAFGVMAYFTFLPPIICTGLIFFNSLAAFVIVPKIGSAV